MSGDDGDRPSKRQRLSDKPAEQSHSPAPSLPDLLAWLDREGVWLSDKLECRDMKDGEGWAIFALENADPHEIGEPCLQCKRSLLSRPPSQQDPQDRRAVHSNQRLPCAAPPQHPQADPADSTAHALPDVRAPRWNEQSLARLPAKPTAGVCPHRLVVGHRGAVWRGRRGRLRVAEAYRGDAEPQADRARRPWTSKSVAAGPVGLRSWTAAE